MQANTKEWIQYGTAIAMITSGIVLAFLSFFLKGDITDGILWYVSQALIYAGGIFGVSIYFKTRLGEFEHRTRMVLEDYMNDRRDPHGPEHGDFQDWHHGAEGGSGPDIHMDGEPHHPGHHRP